MNKKCKSVRYNESDKRGTEKITTVYAIQGRKVCLKAFAAIKNLSTQVVTRHSKEVLISFSSTPYRTGRKTSRKGKRCLHKVVVQAFLLQLAMDYGI